MSETQAQTRQFALGIDLGGTNLRSAVVTADGEIVFETHRPTFATEGVDSVVDRIALAVREAADEAGVASDVPVGVAAPGPLDPRSGIVHFAPNLPGWSNVQLRDRLQKMTGRPVVLGNDANAAALGEFIFGAGRGSQNMIYVGLGTGVGGGVISEGRLIDGAHGMGGELGHVSVDLDGPRCTCGSSGCIEAFCSTWSITHEAKLLVSSGRGDAILAAAEDGTVGPRAVGAAAANGDPAARALLDRAGTALGAGLANFINIFNTEIIVLGGGVAEIGEPLLGPVRRAIDTFAMPVMRQGVRLIPSSLGLKTGIYGSAALVFYENHP
ncbi:MAG TPA: ROK family protein [Thermomicrobiales bacterium]|nr:ROK family protein [Thermomicrobiales bacterium]